MESVVEIGTYRVVRRLGVGGMAEAFEGVRALTGSAEQRVCIKRLLPAYADDPAYLTRFRREAAIATRLRHPNIVAVLDAGETGQTYLVLELVDGIDLLRLLRTAPNRRMQPGVVTYLAMELAYALDYAHTESGEHPAIVHRDLTPSNVLLSRGGDVKLADFGLAKPVQGGDVTQSGSMPGKIPYLPPEQMRGEAVDGRADLFSLGVILYECLAGRRPFDGAHEYETMIRVLADRRDPLLVAAPDTPPELAALVESLLAHDRDARPPDARTVLTLLDACAPPARARMDMLDLVESRLGGVESRRHVKTRRRIDGIVSDPDVNAEPLAVGDDPGPGEDLTARVGRPRSNPPPADALALADTALADRPTSTDLGSVASPVPIVTLGTQTNAAGEANEAPTTGAHSPRTRASSAARFAPWLLAGAIGLGVVSGWTPRRSETPATPPREEAASPVMRAEARTGGATAVSARDKTPADPSAALEWSASLAPGSPHEAGPASAASESQTSAFVRVSVHPWGLVWIDGRSVGRAPRVLELHPGVHRISVGQQEPLQNRRVDVASGEHRAIEFNLADVR